MPGKQASVQLLTDRCVLPADIYIETDMTLADDLRTIADLRANGSLTENEFNLAKERLLGGESMSGNAAMSRSVNAFRRSRTDRWLGGICGGVARSTGTEAWFWRLLFAMLFICAGVGLLVYLLLWIFVPSD